MASRSGCMKRSTCTVARRNRGVHDRAPRLDSLTPHTAACKPVDPAVENAVGGFGSAWVSTKTNSSSNVSICHEAMECIVFEVHEVCIFMSSCSVISVCIVGDLGQVYFAIALIDHVPVFFVSGVSACRESFSIAIQSP